MLTTFNVVTFVDCAVGPRFNTVAVLLIFVPLATILCAVQMAVSSETMGLVMPPIAVVDVAVGVDQPSLAVGLIVGPVALVDGAIWPDLHAFALTDVGASQPLALILGAIIQHHHWASVVLTQRLLKLVVIVCKRPKLPPKFLN